MSNLLAVEGIPVAPNDGEFFETLIKGGGELKVERIVSRGHTTPEGEWYDQEQDEWVVVLQGEARVLLENEPEIRLRQGDHVLLPAHKRHRVTYTSSPCVWLAVFADRLRIERPR